MTSERTSDASPTPKRRLIDRANVSRALAERERRDAETPPASLLTTMGAIRLLGDLVFDREQRGWTDPMLVALLRELGVEISAETLRVYRGRLKKERGETAATTSETGKQEKGTASEPDSPARDDGRRSVQAQPKIETAASGHPQPASTSRPPEQPRPASSAAFDDLV